MLPKMHDILGLKGQRSARKVYWAMAGYGGVLLALVLIITTAPSVNTALVLLVPTLGALFLVASDHFRLITENDRLSHEGFTLDRKAHSDPLTGLMNRMAFRNVLEEARRLKTHGEVALDRKSVV